MLIKIERCYKSKVWDEIINTDEIKKVEPPKNLNSITNSVIHTKDGEVIFSTNSISNLNSLILNENYNH